VNPPVDQRAPQNADEHVRQLAAVNSRQADTIRRLEKQNGDLRREAAGLRDGGQGRLPGV
jgi:hypothetical protein